MPDFKDLGSLFSHLQKQLQTPMKEVGEFVKEETKKTMDDVVYGAGEPTYYADGHGTRTYELRESLQSNQPEIIGNEVVIEVNHDTSKIHSDPVNHIHGSVDYDPQEANEWVPYYVEYGKSGPLFGDGFWREPRPYMETTVEKLEATNEHVSILKSALKSQGFKIE